MDGGFLLGDTADGCGWVDEMDLMREEAERAVLIRSTDSHEPSLEMRRALWLISDGE